MDTASFKAALADKGIILSPKQLEQFDIYYETLVEWNEKMNLTAITDRKEVFLKHFYDSISASFYYDFNREISVCDVGAGAGFPSIPIKICFPEIKLSIVDSLNKRIHFLEHLSSQLGLENCTFYHDRAETFGQNNEVRESFDLVTARAVARLSVLSELCLPLAKKGGHFLAMKGANLPEELKSGEKAIRLLGGKVEEAFAFSLPLEESERYIVLIQKEGVTPKKYPRKPGTPNKAPLE